MNKISYEFSKKEDRYEIIIDDKKTGKYFDAPGLVLSAEQDGVFPMFSGNCGMLGCCGAYVEVESIGDHIIWQKFWNGQCHGKPELEDELLEFKLTEDFIIRPPLVFNRNEYKKLTESLVEDIKKKPDQQKRFLETLERYKSGDRSNM